MIFKLLIICIFCSVYTVNSQNLKFTYDSSGNQVRREIVNIQFNSASKTLPSEDNELKQESDQNDLNLLNAQIDLYPNPVVDLLQVEWSSALKVIKVMLFDNNGRMLQMKNVTSDISTLTFDMSSYSSGMYYIRILDQQNESRAFKIIKK